MLPDTVVHENRDALAGTSGEDLFNGLAYVEGSNTIKADHGARLSNGSCLGSAAG